MRRPTRLRAADRLLTTLWSSGVARRPSLDPEALIRATTGGRLLPDRSGWRHRLFVLCDELNRSARLTPLGLTLAYGQLAAALRDRVRLEALWARHPAILDQPLATPIVIVGQMRSGSTRMQRLLACDPRLGSTRFFESWNPVGRGAGAPLLDDRVWRARFGLAMTRLLNPGFAAIHPTGALAPDEQIGWQAISFFGSTFDTQWRVPAFTALVEQEDAVPAYAEFRRLMQTVAWLRGDDGRRPWVLKIPQFTQDLDALLHVFPDATLLRLHRDRVAVVASSASLVRNQMAVQSNAVSPAWIGRETLRKVMLRETRTETALRHTGARWLPIDYAAIDADWQHELGRVYRFLGLPLSPPVRAAMARTTRRSARPGRTPHRYRLDEFGLTGEEVRARVCAPASDIAAE